MSEPATSTPTAAAAVQRQIVLPLSKAVEIAYKSIRVRLTRSLLVTSGIVLALAFLVSILATEALLGAMRQWAAEAPGGESFQRLRERRTELEGETGAMENEIRLASRAAKAQAAGHTIDPKREFGADLPELQKQLGALPATPAELFAGFAASPELVGKFKHYLDLRRQEIQIKERLDGPQRLLADMKSNGVPTTPDEIRNNRIQTRWLAGLALLVAFVGILNAMLMSVTERFREIGTMKCLGALDGFIVKLFLLESLFQGIAGTVIGIVLGLALSVIAATVRYGAFVWKDFPLVSLLIAAGVCLLVGIGLTVGGAVYPAWKAARMQPVEAMRVEA
jgi:ABC-type antimicrobial peptide transport system permease subunit